MFTRLKTAVVAPDALTRVGIGALLRQQYAYQYSYRIVGSAATAEGLVAHDRAAPEIVLVASSTADDLLAQASACRRRWAGCKVFGVYDCAGDEESERILISDLDGCIPPLLSPKGFIQALDLLLGERGEGRPFLYRRRRAAVRVGEVNGSAGEVSGDVGLPLLPQKVELWRSVPTLSNRELQVLDGIVRGQRNKAIALAHGITEATVKAHMKSILRKVNVENRIQAAVWAMENLPGHGKSGLDAAQGIQDRR